MKQPFTDDDLMPWGKHKDIKLSEVPPSYLLWLYEQPWIRDWPQLHGYLKANEKTIMVEKRNDEPDYGNDMRSYEDYRNYRN